MDVTLREFGFVYRLGESNSYWRKKEADNNRHRYRLVAGIYWLVKNGLFGRRLGGVGWEGDFFAPSFCGRCHFSL